jgi:hypothetical protein
MITDDDIDRVTAAAGSLPPPVGVDGESDFVTDLFVTVIDFQINTTVVLRALAYFRDNRWREIRTMADLESVVARFENDQAGNTELAVYLWNYKFWTRAAMLRQLIDFFDSIDVRDEIALKRWAATAQYKTDFKGRVKGLGHAVFNSLVMRQGVDTVKPDVHVHRFAEAAVGRRLNDSDTVEVVVGAAARLGVKASDLDWAIWEHSRGGPGGARPDG